jgi:hypothetical protein
MNRTKVGVALLSIWSGGNLLLATGILVAMTVLGRDAPSLSILFPAAEIRSLDPRVPAIVDALAVLFNASAVALCGLVLVLTWTGVLSQRRAVFRIVVAGLCLVQGFGFVSDGYLGNRYVTANVVSSAVLVAGLLLMASRRARS